MFNKLKNLYYCLINTRLNKIKRNVKRNELNENLFEFWGRIDNVEV